MDVDTFLEHYGIPGMKWGIRRSRGSAGTVSSAHPTPPSNGSSGSSNGRPAWQSPPSKTVDKPLNKMSKKEALKELKARRELSEDQIVFNALQAKAKKGGITALTNSEIKVLTTRAEALNSYGRTFPKQQSKKAKVAKFFIDDILLNTGQQLLKDAVKYKGQEELIKRGQLPPRKADKKKDDD